MKMVDSLERAEKIALRDKFAMAALSGFLAGEAYSGTEGYTHYNPERAADRAYDIADAMIARREK